MLRKLIRVSGYLIVAALIGYIGYSIGNGDKCVECYQSGIVDTERELRAAIRDSCAFYLGGIKFTPCKDGNYTVRITKSESGRAEWDKR